MSGEAALCSNLEYEKLTRRMPEQEQPAGIQSQSPGGRERSRWWMVAAVGVIAVLGLAGWFAVARKASLGETEDARRRELTALGWQRASEATKLLLALKYKRADRGFADALMVASELSVVRVVRAAGYMGRRRYGSAVNELRIVYGTPSPPPITTRLMAMCYYRSGSKSLARESFERCQADQPDSEQARFYEVLSQGEAARALALLESLVSEYPEYVEARLRRARLRVRRGELVGGIADAVEAIRQEPDNASFWWQLAEHLMAVDRRWAAVPCLERVVVLDPGWAGAFEQLADLAVEVGDFARAREMIEGALEIDTSRRSELEARREQFARRAAASQPAEATEQHPGEQAWRTFLKEIAGSRDHQRLCAKLFLGKVLAKLHESGLADGLPPAPSDAEMSKARSAIRRSEARIRTEVQRILRLP